MANVLDVKLVSGNFASFPINPELLYVDSLEYVQNPYIVSLKAGIAVKFGAEGYITPADKGGTITGFLVTDAANNINQNMATSANGQIAVLIGSANQFITEQVKDDNVVVGDLLYVGDGGVLTKVKEGDAIAVALALSSNSATSKSLLVQSLV